jgi:hypothetical protein
MGSTGMFVILPRFPAFLCVRAGGEERGGGFLRPRQRGDLAAIRPAASANCGSASSRPSASRSEAPVTSSGRSTIAAPASAHANAFSNWFGSLGQEQKRQAVRERAEGGAAGGARRRSAPRDGDLVAGIPCRARERDERQEVPVGGRAAEEDTHVPR